MGIISQCFTHHWVSIIPSNTTGSGNQVILQVVGISQCFTHHWVSIIPSNTHNVLLIIGLALFQVILQVVGIISQCFTHHWVSIIPSNTTGSGNHLTMFYSSLG